MLLPCLAAACALRIAFSSTLTECARENSLILVKPARSEEIPGSVCDGFTLDECVIRDLLQLH